MNPAGVNAGPRASSLPLVTIVDPVVSVAIGVVAFGETIAAFTGTTAGSPQRAADYMIRTSSLRHRDR